MQRSSGIHSSQVKINYPALKKSILNAISAQLQGAWMIAQRQNYSSGEEAGRQFRLYWDAKVQSLFATIINAHDMESLAEQFLKRHPWIASLSHGEVKKREEVERFLKCFMIDQSLLLSSSKGIIRSWNAIDFPKDKFELDKSYGQAALWERCKNENIIRFNAYIVPEQDITHYIEGYPLYHHIVFYEGSKDPQGKVIDYYKFFLYEIGRLVPPNVGAISYSSNTRDNSSQIVKYLPNRIDVFRLLDGHDPEGMEAKPLSDGVQCTKHAPFNLDELPYLTKAQWDNFETLFINKSNDETKPVWIVLHRDKDSKTKPFKIYAPEFVDRHQLLTSLSSLPVKFDSSSIELVDYAENKKLNDFNGLSKEAEWHAVLFGRVLPWLKNGKGIALSNYRSTVPVSVLVQQVLLQCLDNRNDADSVSGIKRQLDLSFKKCWPFSIDTVDARFVKLKAIGPSVNTMFSDYYAESRFFNTIGPAVILTAFDKGILQIVGNQLVVKDENSIAIFCALYLAYHHPELSSLRIVSNKQSISKTNTSTYLDTSIYQILFLCDTNIRAFYCDDHHGFYNQPLSCAARNRFLEAVRPDVLIEVGAKNLPGLRYDLWKKTGAEWVRFLKEGWPLELTATAVTQLMQDKKEWQAVSFGLSLEQVGAMDKAQKINWAFAQFAEMGTYGLEALFTTLIDVYSQKNLDDPDYAPNLTGLFDLSGSLSATTEEYIEGLIKQITLFESRCKINTPLFHSLSLILPDPLDEKLEQVLIELMTLINERKQKFPDEVSEINLYHLGNPSAHSNLIEKLNRLVSQGSNWRVQINVPAWNRTSYTEEKDWQSKADYRALQNGIIRNQQAFNDRSLQDNQAYLQGYMNGKVQPGVTISVAKQSAQKEQPWEGADETYPLSAKTLGVQKQSQAQQQMVQQQEQQQMVQQQEQAMEQEEQEAKKYGIDENNLITRDNIERKCREMWNKVPEDIRNHSGINEDDNLALLFNLWSGGDKYAAHVIRRIEPAAVEKMMWHAGAFRLGISDNLPAGFYLAVSRQRDEGLILCFDGKREKQELRQQRIDNDEARRNPFKMVLRDAGSPNPSRGDCSQFSNLSSVAESSPDRSQQTFGYYLATETEPLDIENRIVARDYIKQNWKKGDRLSNDQLLDVDVVTSIMQWHDKTGHFSAPQDLEQCYQDLSTWISYLGVKVESSLLMALFDRNSSLHLNEKNLCALGQLFSHYSIDAVNRDNKEHISQPTFQHVGQQWWYLINEIWKVFGPEQFAIWKANCLDRSANWAELVEREEVEAIALSLVTLKGNPEYQAIWWQLVQSHGAATGTVVHYADLWHAFEKVLRLIKGKTQDKPLNINASAWFSYLRDNKNFNAQVFLDRLHQVLKKASTQMEANLIQQSILDNINKIDWQHTGFYYASRYDDYFYWDDALKLTHFHPVLMKRNHNENDSYQVTWAQLEEDPVTLTLRFASQRMKLRKTQLDTLKDILLKVVIKKEDDYTVKLKWGNALRTLMACLSVGTDAVDQDGLNAEKILAVLNELMLLNDKHLRNFTALLDLNRQLEPGTFTVKFEHTPSLFNKLGEFIFSSSTLTDHFNDLSPQEQVGIFNACGRARQMSGVNNDIYDVLFARLQTIGLKQASHDLIMAYCPWLLLDKAGENVGRLLQLDKQHENNQEIQFFKTQLKSIDVAKSTYLPTANELASCFTGIKSANTRRTAIRALMKKGCQITVQDFAFRPLTKDERQSAVDFLNEHMRPHFKEQNLLLCKKLLEVLAVKSEGQNTKETILKLFKTLVGIDNKAHFDELGRVVATLMTKTKDTQAVYSVSQLDEWLTLLKGNHYDEAVHYPSNLLNDLIYPAPDSTLLSTDLDVLRSEAPQDTKDTLNTIVNAKLSSQCQSALVKLMIAGPAHKGLLDVAMKLLTSHQDAPSEWLNAMSQFISLQGIPIEQRQLFLSALHTSFVQDDINGRLLYKSQVKLINSCLKQTEQTGYLNKIISGQNTNILIILSHITLNKKPINWSSDDDFAKVVDLMTELNRLDPADLADIAARAHLEPFPSVPVLTRLLQLGAEELEKEEVEIENGSTESKKVACLFERFERVEQAKDEDGKEKYDYSISPADRENILRVIKGFKVKGQGHVADAIQKKLPNLLYYCNQFSLDKQLHRLSSKNLKGEFNAAVEMLQQFPDNRYAAAGLLACMRMILLRKTGKWANHTQMLVLLYAALRGSLNLGYQKKDCLYEMRTGEGKSILTVMRTAYLALTGHFIDVYSSKNSLSERDHDEFAPVLDAMGIKHAYITSDSPADVYQTGSQKPGIGALNYFTIGDANLHHMANHWEDDRGSRVELKDKRKRVAWLDEVDHLLKNEQTQSNYSAREEGSDANYNRDEWVYRLTHDYYYTIKDTIPGAAEGYSYITRLKHLKGLCDYLQKHVDTAPKESTFIQKYLLPALPMANGDIDENAIKRRDEELKKLLLAAHIATYLKQDMDFCVRPQVIQKTIGNSAIGTRFANVVINAVLNEGSTYSDLVHQFLHVRLNKEAVKLGQIPYFFVEPVTDIVLSQNAEYVLTHRYGVIEGSTATTGNEFDLEEYRRIYGINHVVKVPTHLPPKTQFLPTVYCSSRAEQIERFAQYIMENKDGHPILVHCENDIEVKKISSEVQDQLRKMGGDSSHIIADTNDSGVSENDMLPHVGKPYAVTFSSRMGRGTDPKPELGKYLKVGSTYPDSPSEQKQRRGRQGRNGAAGECIDIIFYKPIEDEYNSYLQDLNLKEKLLAILDWQTKHLDEKIQKHQINSSPKWQWVEQNKEQKEKYLITRSVVQLRQEIKTEKERYLRGKEGLIAALSGEMLDVLHVLTDIRRPFKESWLKCRKEIEADWNAHLNGQDGDSPELYNRFVMQAKAHWGTFCAEFPALKFAALDFNTFLLSPLPNVQPKDEIAIRPAVMTEEKLDLSPRTSVLDMPVVLQFYQAWIRGMERQYSDNSHSAYRGDHHQDRELFYSVLAKASLTDQKDEKKTQILFEKLTSMVEQYPAAIYRTSYKNMVEIIELLSKQTTVEHFNYCWSVIEKVIASLCNEKGLAGINPLMHLMLEIIKKQDINKEVSSKGQFIFNLIDEIHQHRTWPNIVLGHAFEKINSFFAGDETITRLLSSEVADRDKISTIVQLLGDEQDKNAQKKITIAQEYLKANQEKIAKCPYLMQPILRLILHPYRILSGVDVLPEPDSLSFLISLTGKNDLEIKAWEFLANRPSLEKQDVQAYIRILQNLAKHNDIKSIEQWVSLPPMSLQYAVQHNVSIKELKKAGSIFNEYVYNKGLVTHSQFYSPCVGREKEFELHLAIMESMNPLDAADFFAAAQQYVSISLEELEPIAALYQQKKINKKTLDTLLALAEKLPQFSQYEDIASQWNDIKQGVDHLNESCAALSEKINQIEMTTQRLHKKRSYIDSRYHPAIDSWIEKVSQETTSNSKDFIQHAGDLANDLEKIRNTMDHVREKINQCAHGNYTNSFNRFLREAVWDNAKDQGSKQVLKKIAIFVRHLEKTISIMDVTAEKLERLPNAALKEAITTSTQIRDEKIEDMLNDLSKLDSHLDRVILAIKSTQKNIAYLPAALQHKARELLERACEKTYTTYKDVQPLDNFELTVYRLADKFNTLINKINAVNDKISHAELKDIFDGFWKKTLSTLANKKSFDAMIAEVGAFMRSIKEIKLTMDSIKENINRLPDELKERVSTYKEKILQSDSISNMANQAIQLKNSLDNIVLPISRVEEKISGKIFGLPRLSDGLKIKIQFLWKEILNGLDIQDPREHSKRIAEFEINLDKIIKSSNQITKILYPSILQDKVTDHWSSIKDGKDGEDMANRAIRISALLSRIKPKAEQIDNTIKQLHEEQAAKVFSLWNPILNQLHADGLEQNDAEINEFHGHLNKLKENIDHIESIKGRLSGKQQEIIRFYLNQVFKQPDLTIVAVLKQVNELRNRLDIIETIPSVGDHFEMILVAWNKLGDILLVKRSAEILRQIHALMTIWPRDELLHMANLYLRSDMSDAINLRYEAFLNFITQPRNAKIGELAAYIPYASYLNGEMEQGNRVLERSLHNCKLLQKLDKNYPGLLAAFKRFKESRFIVTLSELTQFLEILSQENSNELNKEAVLTVFRQYFSNAKEKDVAFNPDKFLEVLSVIKQIKTIASRWPKIMTSTAAIFSTEEKLLIDYLPNFETPQYTQEYKNFFGLIDKLTMDSVLDDKLFSMLCLCHVKAKVDPALLDKIVTFSKKYPEAATQGQMQDVNTICDNSNMFFYDAFFHALNKKKYAVLSENLISNATQCCFQAHFGTDTHKKNTCIQDMEAALKKAVEVQKKANVLTAAFASGDEDNYGPYFASLASSQETEDRREIMQYLYHDLLRNDGQHNDQFPRRCFTHHKRLAYQALNSMADPHGNKMNARFQKLTDFLKEINQITTHPFAAKSSMDQPRQNEGKMVFDNKEIEHFNLMFKNRKEIYKRYSTGTRNINFFNKLSQLHCHTRIRKDYYEGILRCIGQAQESILKDDYVYNRDHFFKRNTKGYSRLYNICNDMFLVVSRQYLWDDNISQHQKAEFFDGLLKTQLKFHLEYFQKYLQDTQIQTLDHLRVVTNECILVTDGQMTVGNVDALSRLSAGIGALDRKQIPKHLNYLIENISHLLHLSYEGAKQQPIMPHGDGKPQLRKLKPVTGSVPHNDNAPKKISHQHGGRGKS